MLLFNNTTYSTPIYLYMVGIQSFYMTVITNFPIRVIDFTHGIVYNKIV